MSFDFCVVGAGCYGATFARIAAECGKNVLVVDQRSHVGGNAYTREETSGGFKYDVHMFGAHIFHTNDIKLRNWVERFQGWRTYCYSPIARVGEMNYSFPINMKTFQQVYGVRNQIEATEMLISIQSKIDEVKTAEDYLYANVGKLFTEMFYRGYSYKHWGLDLSELPSSIVQRVPIRTSDDESYFRHRFQMMPLTGGYTTMFENMLDHPRIKVELEKSVTIDEAKALGSKVVYSGQIDKAMNYEHGVLPSRSLKFEMKEISAGIEKVMNFGAFSGKAVVNLCDIDDKYTRIIDHAAFSILDGRCLPTERLFTFESAMTEQEAMETQADPMYPIQTRRNMAKYEAYKHSASKESSWLSFGGRCGSYKYLDMDAAMQQAVTHAKKRFGLETERVVN